MRTLLFSLACGRFRARAIHAALAVLATGALAGCESESNPPAVAADTADTSGGFDAALGTDTASGADAGADDATAATDATASTDTTADTDTTAGTDAADATASDTAESDSAEADTAATDAVLTDAQQPDTVQADTTPADTTPADTTPADTTPADTSSADTAGADALVDPSQVSCGGASPKFPAYATACASDADCAVGLHQIDCCGSQVAVGVASGALSSFAAAEAICAEQYPDCKCAQKPPLAQDGVYVADPAGIVARCVDGTCLAKAKDGPNCQDGAGWSPSKWCQKTSDCTYAMHRVDCCGSEQAVGVTKVAKSAYEKTEYQCAPEPICDCIPKPVTAEDGGSAGDGLIAVTCEAGLCQTYIKN